MNSITNNNHNINNKQNIKTKKIAIVLELVVL